MGSIGSTDIKDNGNRMLSNLAESIYLLMTMEDYREAIQSSLILIGEAADVDRVYLFENSKDESGNYFTSQRFEWASYTSPPQIDNPELQDVPFEAVYDFVEPMIEGNPFIKHVSEIKDPELKDILEKQNIKSIIALPIYIENEFWGFIGFDECKAKRVWHQWEKDVLKAYTNAVAKAIERSRLLKELTMAKFDAEKQISDTQESILDIAIKMKQPLESLHDSLDEMTLAHPQLKDSIPMRTLRESLIQLAALHNQLQLPTDRDQDRHIICLLSFRKSNSFPSDLIRYLRLEGFNVMSHCVEETGFIETCNNDYDLIMIDVTTAPEQAFEWMHAHIDGLPHKAGILCHFSENDSDLIEEAYENGTDFHIVKTNQYASYFEMIDFVLQMRKLLTHYSNDTEFILSLSERMNDEYKTMKMSFVEHMENQMATPSLDILRLLNGNILAFDNRAATLIIHQIEKNIRGNDWNQAAIQWAKLDHQLTRFLDLMIQALTLQRRRRT